MLLFRHGRLRQGLNAIVKHMSWSPAFSILALHHPVIAKNVFPKTGWKKLPSCTSVAPVASRTTRPHDTHCTSTGIHLTRSSAIPSPKLLAWNCCPHVCIIQQVTKLYISLRNCRQLVGHYRPHHHIPVPGPSVPDTNNRILQTDWTGNAYWLHDKTHSCQKHRLEHIVHKVLQKLDQVIFSRQRLVDVDSSFIETSNLYIANCMTSSFCCSPIHSSLEFLVTTKQESQVISVEECHVAEYRFDHWKKHAKSSFWVFKPYMYMAQ